MESVPFCWGHNGPKWEINKKNKNIIKYIGPIGWNSIYSVDTFNSNQFQKIQFELKIIKRRDSLCIGIINNFQHKNTWFTQKEIPNNNEMQINFKKFNLN